MLPTIVNRRAPSRRPQNRGTPSRVRTLLAAALPVVVLCGVTSLRAQGTCSGVTPINGATLSSFAVVTGLPGRPLFLTAPPGDRDRLFVVEQSGRVRIHKRGDAPGVNLTFLDITDRVQASPILDEMGLLGLAFDPDYATNGFFYVNYTEGGLTAPWNTVLSRFSRSDADPDALWLHAVRSPF